MGISTFEDSYAISLKDTTQLENTVEPIKKEKSSMLPVLSWILLKEKRLQVMIQKKATILKQSCSQF